MEKWHFATEDCCCPTARIDPSVGGVSCCRMAAMSGSLVSDFQGEFTSIEPGWRIEVSLVTTASRASSPSQPKALDAGRRDDGRRGCAFRGAAEEGLAVYPEQMQSVRRVPVPLVVAGTRPGTHRGLEIADSRSERAWKWAGGRRFPEER